MSSIKGVAMKLDFDLNTKRMIADMSKEEAWALRELLSRLESKSYIKKEYLRAFNAMIHKDTWKRKEAEHYPNTLRKWLEVIEGIDCEKKKLNWEKPELVEICPQETKGIARCVDICTGGDYGWIC